MRGKPRNRNTDMTLISRKEREKLMKALLYDRETAKKIRQQLWGSYLKEKQMGNYPKAESLKRAISRIKIKW